MSCSCVQYLLAPLVFLSPTTDQIVWGEVTRDTAGTAGQFKRI
jgi:hypothetical protein